MAEIKNLLFVSILFVSVAATGQNKKMDRLEMYYDQGNYEIVFRKSNRYLNKPQYDNYLEPSFYKALAALKISEKGDAKFSPETSVSLYKDFLAKSPEPAFLTAHRSEILDYKSAIQRQVVRLNDLGKTKEARDLLADMNIIFDENLAYAEVIKVPVKTANDNQKTNESTTANLNLRDSIIDYSKQFMGVPYKWGGNDPSGFDCSGFTKYVMANHGYDIPRIAGDQYRSAEKVDVRKADKGDLVFFGTRNNITHVGIVVSSPGEPLTMIHASSSRGIMISNIEKSSYWRPKQRMVVPISMGSI